ncbi:MAG: hypothetical protein RR553_08325 [Akkermansia sp.]
MMNDEVTSLQYFMVQGSSLDVFLRGDEVELDAEFFPDGDLVVELGSRPSVEGREADDGEDFKHLFYCNI